MEMGRQFQHAGAWTLYHVDPEVAVRNLIALLIIRCPATEIAFRSGRVWQGGGYGHGPVGVRWHHDCHHIEYVRLLLC